MTPPLRAALVTVGDELLLGRTVDTNAAWLGRALAERGVPVVRRYTVADQEEEIRHAVAEASGVAELVLVTGGLGPTPDDLTRDAVACLLGRPLLEDEDILERIRRRFLERGVTELPGPNRRVAQVPEGALKLDNPLGTAPGLALESPGGVVVLLPGVPREMKGIFQGALSAFLERRFSGRLRPVHVRFIHTTGIPESLLAQQVAERLPEGAGSVSLAFLPDLRGVDLRFTAVDQTEDEARQRFDALEAALFSVVEPWRFHAASGDLAEAVVLALRERGRTVAVAESCTGGLIAKRLTDVPGASQVFAGGVVAYANPVKEGLLGVPASLLERHGAVSGPVASRMAHGVAEALGVRTGVGVTGVAGPGGGTDEKPVGTVWYSCSVDGASATRLQRFPGDREEVRERAAQGALFLLLGLLDGRVAPDQG